MLLLSAPLEECTICLEHITAALSVATISTCGHYYHEECLLRWSANSNSCPTCRKLYYQVRIATKEKPLATRTVAIQDRLLSTDAINLIPREYIIPANTVPHENNIQAVALAANDSSGVCSICSSADYRTSRVRRTISCQMCASKFHLSCLGISAVARQIEEWCCPMCDYSQELVAPPIPRPGGAIFRASANRRIEVEADDQPSEYSIRRGGLLLRNESYDSNNDPHANDFEFDNDLDNYSAVSSAASRPLPHYSIPVLNGGVLLRREMRERQNLTHDEAKSWDLFNQAKNIEGPAEPVQMRQDRPSTEPTRRRRKKRVQITENTSSDAHSVPETTNIAGTTRIGTLMNQIKMTSSSTCRPSARRDTPISGSSNSSNDEYPCQSLPSSSGSVCQSPEVFSPPVELQASENKDNQTDVDQDNVSDIEVSTRKKVCQGQTKPYTRLLTLEQKTQIQRLVRGRLKPLYRPNAASKNDTNSMVIQTEEQFITINKRISRRVYEHILAPGNNQPSLESLFELTSSGLNLQENSLLQNLVDGFVETTLRQ